MQYPFARTLLASALLIAGIGSAAAETVKVKLSGAEETPPVTTSASGTAEFEIAADHSISGSVTTSGVDGTAGHIHLGEPGKSGPPVVHLTKGEGGSWTVPADAKLNDEQYAAFKAGKLYVNIHSAANKPGEIRGQLKP